MTSYSYTAKRLGCHLRIGKYGFRFFGPKLGGGRKLLSYTSLDGWIFDPDEIVRAIRLDDDMQVIDLLAIDPNTSKELPSDAPTDALQKEQK